MGLAVAVTRGEVDLDGLETARLLKRESATSAIPIVALTGQAVLDDADRVRAKGFAELITKPVNPLGI